MAVGRIQFEQGFALGEQIPEPTAVLPIPNDMALVMQMVRQGGPR